MILHDIDFGHIWGGSGVQGFFGEGYWFHKYLRPFGLNFDGMTFVAKTSTLAPRIGNMPLRKDFTPKELFPRCIKISFLQGSAINAVGLSNPGIGALLLTAEWQTFPKPFWLSVMPVADSPEDRLCEMQGLVNVLASQKDNFSAPFGIQINASCPNTGHDLEELVNEVIEWLVVFRPLGVPVIIKFSAEQVTSIAAYEIAKDVCCDGICVSNTFPVPFSKFGAGGESGKRLKKKTCNWIKEVRNLGFEKHINGGGGILCKSDVKDYYDAGADSVFISSVSFLRFWRVQGIIQYANQLFGGE